MVGTLLAGLDMSVYNGILLLYLIQVRKLGTHGISECFFKFSMTQKDQNILASPLQASTSDVGIHVECVSNP